MIIIVLILVFTFVGGLLIGMSIVSPKYPQQYPQPSPIIFYNKQRVNSAEIDVFNDDGWGTCPVNGDPRECVVIVDPS